MTEIMVIDQLGGQDHFLAQMGFRRFAAQDSYLCIRLGADYGTVIPSVKYSHC